MKVAIIGGGAAGFFSAISVKENYPDAEVVIFEKSQKLLRQREKPKRRAYKKNGKL